MDGTHFDRIVRTLVGLRSRRQLLAALGAVVLPRPAPVRATQLDLPACAEAGAVCTLIRGCCAGLVCATSTINTGYGVCVTGEGGMLPVSDDIVVPSSEGIEAELAQEVAAVAASATTTTDPNADRQVRIDAKRAKRTNRRSTRKTTNDTQRTTKDTRRNTRRLNAAPQMTLELMQEGSGGSEQPETVRIVNADDVAVVVTRVEAMQQPHLFATGTVTIPAGSTYLLYSGANAPDPPPSASVALVWTEEKICPDGGGVTLTAQQSGGTQTHRVSVPCGAATSAVNTQTNSNDKQKRTKEQKQQRRDRKRDRHARRRQHKH